MRSLILSFLIFIFIATPSWAQSESSPNLHVVHCETVEEVNAAKAQGATFIEFLNRYWVKIGDEYKGSFKSFNAAKSVLAKYQGIPAEALIPSPTEVESATSTEMSVTQPIDGPMYNPGVILYPFVDYDADEGLVMTVPSGVPVSASHIMIHPEPLMFDEISFGLIDLGRMAQYVQQRSDNVASGQPVSIPPVLRSYFSVVGKIVARPSIELPTDALDVSVGMAVISTNGTTLLKTYGNVDLHLNFKCIVERPVTTLYPQSLLLFAVAKGSLKEMLRPADHFPEMDASGYTYHILCSTILEMGPDWYPPLEEATKEEMQKLFDAMKRIRQSQNQPPSNRP